MNSSMSRQAAVKISLLSASAIILAAAGPASAQSAAPGSQDQNGQQLEEIIVTATKTGATNLQRTPIAITSFTPEELDARNIQDIKGLVEYTPGLQISDINGYAQLYIRGVGSNTVYIGSDPSNDDPYGRRLSSPAARLFFRFPRCRTGRGAAGAAGHALWPQLGRRHDQHHLEKAVRYTYTGEVEASVGTYNEYSVKGYVSGPVAGTPLLFSLSVRAACRTIRTSTISRPAGGIGNQDSAMALRGQLYLPVGDQFEATVRADYYELGRSDRRAPPSFCSRSACLPMMQS